MDDVFPTCGPDLTPRMVVVCLIETIVQASGTERRNQIERTEKARGPLAKFRRQLYRKPGTGARDA